MKNCTHLTYLLVSRRPQSFFSIGKGTSGLVKAKFPSHPARNLFVAMWTRRGVSSTTFTLSFGRCIWFLTRLLLSLDSPSILIHLVHNLVILMTQHFAKSVEGIWHCDVSISRSFAKWVLLELKYCSVFELISYKMSLTFLFMKSAQLHCDYFNCIAIISLLKGYRCSFAW